jgi:plasmid stabilization system protein ParE
MGRRWLNGIHDREGFSSNKRKILRDQVSSCGEMEHSGQNRHVIEPGLLKTGRWKFVVLRYRLAPVEQE